MVFSSLKKENDFKRVFSKGKSFGNRQLVLYYIPNGLDYHRVGFSISKKVGKAVVRNLYRRRLKAIFRSIALDDCFYDMIVIVRRTDVMPDFDGLKGSFEHLLLKTKLVKKL